MVEDTNPTVTLEFYVISSGIGDVLRHTKIASQFKDIWASEFHYNESGQAVFPKKKSSVLPTRQGTFFTSKRVSSASLPKVSHLT
jgi:hypothetical protein